MAFLCSKLHRKELKISCFSPAINGKAPAHEFSHPGYPGGIEAAFSLKINTFSDRRGGEIMAVFRIEKTCDYTVMSNHHLCNAGQSLKSKGLLSMMLSLL